MKRRLGKTELWRFPIMGEETWAGVNALQAFIPDTGTTHHSRRYDHVTPTQQFTQFTQNQP
jgi:hypothetical protein